MFNFVTFVTLSIKDLPNSVKMAKAALVVKSTPFRKAHNAHKSIVTGTAIITKINSYTFVSHSLGKKEINKSFVMFIVVL